MNENEEDSLLSENEANNENSNDISRDSESDENDEQYHVNEDDCQPREADYTKANKLQFAKLCQKLDRIWAQRKKLTNKQTKETLLSYLLPSSLSKYLQSDDDAAVHGSPYPFFRLILPDIDTSRPHCGMKESIIATSYGEAIGLGRESPDFKKLRNYNDPALAGPTACGDLSIAVQEVIEKRFSYDPSKITIGKVNQLLDELANIRRMDVASSGNGDHYWQASESRSSLQYKGTGPLIKKQKIRTKWVHKLIAMKMSSLEHKWIVRILLQRLDIGFGYRAILGRYHPWAIDLYNSNNSLKRLCIALSDPEWIRRKKEHLEKENKKIEDINRREHLPRSSEPASLGSTLAPMLAMRTSFTTILTDIQKRHKAYMDTLEIDDINRSRLALKFPAFVCEVKLDGERILSHINRGIVTMQTRNSTWYSRLYSPVLGPALRKSIEKYDVDVIFDGEVISWDDGRKETIPFGSNRTVANARRKWCHNHGLLDERDLDLHCDDEDINVMRTSESNLRRSSLRDNEQGAGCWLKYYIFDILYVGGPAASELITNAFRKFDSNYPRPPCNGSLLDLDLYQRKVILYELVTSQENIVELVEGVVISSDGQMKESQEYFMQSQPSFKGFNLMTVDSINCTLDGVVSSIDEIDKLRKGNRSDLAIDQERANHLDNYYQEIVDHRCLEGIVFKDLSTPYGLGDKFRCMGYWFKLKNDYEKHGNTADIDVVVVGASYATGLSRSGLLNSFLVGCTDANSLGPTKYMTLGSINGGGMTFEKLGKLLTLTGYKINSSKDTIELGKWFKMPNHGKDVPGFISMKSYQRSMDGDLDGWKCKKVQYPDLWIEPENSFVLTINASEIVSSNDYSAGVTLRFPRISQIRVEGFDGNSKHTFEVESVSDLHDIYFQRRSQQYLASQEIFSQTQDAIYSQNFPQSSQNRFLSQSQLAKKSKSRKSRRSNSRNTLEMQISNVSRKTEFESDIFGGFSFAVLEGTYTLNSNDPISQEAREQGWYGKASTVKSRDDVMDFVLKHRGKCDVTGNGDVDFIIGGKIDDARVVIHRDAMLNHSGKYSKFESINPSCSIDKIGGVIRWTFLYYTIHHVTSDKCNFNLSSTTINDDTKVCSMDHTKLLSPRFHTPNRIVLRPRRHDFLFLTKEKENSLFGSEDESGVPLWKDSDEVTFRQALHEVAKKKQKINQSQSSHLPLLNASSDSSSYPLSISRPISSWQRKSISALSDDERWIFSCKYQKLWRYDKNPSKKRREPVVVYPDLFGVDFGYKYLNTTKEDDQKTKSRWTQITESTNDIASVLPLVRSMGATITPHLHSKVTHILGTFQFLEDIIMLDDMELIHQYHSNGNELYKRLFEFKTSTVGRDNFSPSPISLISTDWIRNQWSD